MAQNHHVSYLQALSPKKKTIISATMRTKRSLGASSFMRTFLTGPNSTIPILVSPLLSSLLNHSKAVLVVDRS